MVDHTFCLFFQFGYDWQKYLANLPNFTNQLEFRKKNSIVTHEFSLYLHRFLCGFLNSVNYGISAKYFYLEVTVMHELPHSNTKRLQCSSGDVFSRDISVRLSIC